MSLLLKDAPPEVLLDIVPEVDAFGEVESLNDVLKGMDGRLVSCESCREGEKCAKSPRHPGELPLYENGLLFWGLCFKGSEFAFRAKLQKAGIGQRFIRCTLDSFKPATKTQKATLKQIRQYVENLPGTDKGLIFTGHVGTGKTHLTAAIIREATAKGIRAEFVQVPSVLASIRAAIGKGDEDAKNIIQRYGSVALLVLDDLGSERVTDWVREQLFLLINTRYEAMLPTVVTTNDTLEELEDHIGQRIVSRIMQMCDGIALDGADYRKKAA